MPRFPQKPTSKCCCEDSYFIDETINAKLEDLQNQLYNKQDKLSAGENINIIDNVISAKDTTYTAGTNITIVDNVISATTEPTPPTPTGEYSIYVYNGVVEVIDLSELTADWHEQKVDASIIDTKFTYTFSDTNKKCYPAFLIPADFGELKAVYQNGLAYFNIVSFFVKESVKINNINYLLYKMDEETFINKDKFDFYWK
jgi:hypothetical protein